MEWIQWESFWKSAKCLLCKDIQWQKEPKYSNWLSKHMCGIQKPDRLPWWFLVDPVWYKMLVNAKVPPGKKPWRVGWWQLGRVTASAEPAACLPGTMWGSGSDHRPGGCSAAAGPLLSLPSAPGAAFPADSCAGEMPGDPGRGSETSICLLKL